MSKDSDKDTNPEWIRAAVLIVTSGSIGLFGGVAPSYLTDSDIQRQIENLRVESQKTEFIINQTIPEIKQDVKSVKDELSELNRRMIVNAQVPSK